MHEWNEATPGGRGLRGGTFYNDGGGNNVITLHASFRGWDAPTDEYALRGFRVAEVPEPATLSLLALGGLARISHRSRNWTVDCG